MPLLLRLLILLLIASICGAGCRKPVDTLNGTWRWDWSERNGDNVGFEQWTLGAGNAYQRIYRGEIKSKSFLNEEEESGTYEIKGDHIIFHARTYRMQRPRRDGTVETVTSKRYDTENGFRVSGDEMTIWAVDDPSQRGTGKRIRN